MASSRYLTSLLFALAPVAAQAFSFSPDSCRVPDPQGYIHISLGETVFRVDPELMNVLTSPDPRHVLPSPPDSQQPAGCPEHPLAQQSLIIDFGLNAWLKDRHKPSTSLLRQFRLIHVPADYWGWDDSRLHTMMCDRWSRRRYLENGLVGCLVDFDPARPDRAESGAYQISAEQYSEPFGKPFTFSCLPDPPGGVVCGVSYKLYPTVNLVYRFNTARIPLEDVIEFDKHMRNNISKAVVLDYPWRR